MTPDQERWAEALAVLRMHGDEARDFVIERLTELAIAGDRAGVARWREIEARVDQMREAEERPQ